MFRGFLMLAAAAGMLAACSAADPAQQSCAQPSATPSLRTMTWGYYPGYGCGPVPPAQTHFS